MPLGKDRLARLGITLFLMVFITSYASVGFSHGEYFPFSSFKMFSNIKVAGRRGKSSKSHHFELSAEMADGRILPLSLPLGPAQFNWSMNFMLHKKRKPRMLVDKMEPLLTAIAIDQLRKKGESGEIKAVSVHKVGLKTTAGKAPKRTKAKLIRRFVLSEAP